MASYDKLVLVTRRTRLEELIERFNTRGQAKFYIEHAGGDFGDYEREHDTYQRALDRLAARPRLRPAAAGHRPQPRPHLHLRGRTTWW